MTKTKGAKNISQVDKEDMKAIIIPRLKFRDSNDDLLETLEDKGYNVSVATIQLLKKDIRDGLGDRFKEIGEFELAEEHDMAGRSGRPTDRASR